MIDSDDSSSQLVLADTNVLIYAHDPTDPVKHATARRLLSGVLTDGRLVLSVQTMNEFFSVMTRPNRAVTLATAEASAILRDISEVCRVVPVSADIAFRAMGAPPSHGLAFWDALIWAAAKQSGATVLYTEDFQHGREIEGVRIVNPFVPGP
jgi:predicted nucleic acid-binding protein